MGPENDNPLEELRSLVAKIGAATDLDALKPVYFKLSEIAQSHPDDFDVQMAISELKELLLARGRVLKKHDEPSGTSLPGVPPPVPPPPTPEPPPPAPVAAPVPPARPATVPAMPRAARKSNRTVIMALLAVALLVVVIVTILVARGRKHTPEVAMVQVDIATFPAGASVRISPTQAGAAGMHESTCKSNCRLALAAGDYQVTAALDGYDPAASSVKLTPGRPAALSLTLQAQPQSVRILTDLDQGKVAVNDQPPLDLQEGQFVLDKAAPGAYTIKVTGRNADASFSFEIADAKAPVVTGPVTARNLIAMLVSSFGKQAHMVTNSGPLKLAVNGQPQTDVGPAGVDLTGFQTGVDEIVLGDGQDQHTMSETFPAAPMLTVFLKSDVNAGTLIVSTGQDDVRVFLNNQEYRRHTQRGELRVQRLGKVTVRVEKNGFQEEPPQTADVKKGAEVRLKFDLKPQPQFGSLQIRGAAAGTEVWLDQSKAGAVGPDGSFALNTVPPGDHAVELRRDQHVPKRQTRSFVAGQTITLQGADVVLVSANGTIRITRNPPTAAVTYRRGGETESHEFRGNQLDLPAGSYAIAGTAPGFSDFTTNVQLAGGEVREVDVRLPARERPVTAPAPVAVTGGIGDFDDAAAWKKDGDVWVRKGGSYVTYKLKPKGVFTFTVELLKSGGPLHVGSLFGSGAIRWVVQYIDPKNYLLYEMRSKELWAGVVEKGKKYERVKTPHAEEKQKSFTMQVEITPEHVVNRLMVGNEWKTLDTFSEPGRDFTQGKFGFLIQGNDEIAISNFKFNPR